MNNVEGNWEYFKRYIDDKSEILAWDNSEDAEHLPVTKGNRLKFTNDDSMFVFGGNSQVMIHNPPISFSLKVTRCEYLSKCFDCVHYTSQATGGGDVRILETLLALKCDYKERVELIIGAMPKVYCHSRMAC